MDEEKTPGEYEEDEYETCGPYEDVDPYELDDKVEKLRECPFCLNVDVAPTNDRVNRRAQVYCRNCGAAGPLRGSIIGFMTSWNSAPRPADMELAIRVSKAAGDMLARLCKSYRALNGGGCEGCDLLADKICPHQNGDDNWPLIWLHYIRRRRYKF